MAKNTKKATANQLASVFIAALVLLLTPAFCNAQTLVSLLPVPRQQFFAADGTPLAGGCVFTYVSGTSTPLATYVDSSGLIVNSNPVILDSGGFASIWLSQSTYRILVYSSGGTNCATGQQQWLVDGVSDPGFWYTTKAVLLAPTGGALQTVAGPLAAKYFQQTQIGTISAGIEPNYLAPIGTFYTATNQPGWSVTAPAVAGQVYTIPDPATPTAHFLLDGGAANTLNCTAGVITCQRTASFYFLGASCNGGTPSLGWDTFSTNNPLSFCLTGTNTVKGVMGLPAAYTHLQQNTGTNSASTTITTTYPNTTLSGDMLVVSIAFNATTTITGCTDGTNAYSQAKHVANGALSVDIWVFHGAASKAAGTTLTCTFAGAATGALKWHEYLVPNTTSTDVTASNTGTGTAVTTGTTASTAQATELVFAAAGDLAAPTLVPATTGYADHAVLNNATTVQVDDAGIIQQTISGQSAGFTLGASQSWAAAIATFKATSAGPAIAQKTIVLPTFFNASQAVNSYIQWSSPLVAIGASNVVLGGAIVCTGQGTTDDPVFNAATMATSAAGQSAINTTAQVSLSGLTVTGCAAGNILHYQISRQRYNAGDIYEGFANVYGDLVTIGITQ